MDKKLFVNPDRMSAILTFDSISVMLNGHPTDVDMKIDEAKGTASGSMFIAGIPFKINRDTQNNAVIFVGEDDMWVIPDEEKLFVLNLELKRETSKFDFNQMLFEGEVYFRDIPYHTTDHHSSTIKELAKIQEEEAKELAKKDMEQEGLMPDVSVKKLEIDVLLGAIEDLASKNGWIKKGTHLPLDDDALYKLIIEHNSDIMTYFETKLEYSGAEAVTRMLVFLDKDNVIADKKQIKVAKNTLPKAMKRIVTLKQVKSGAVLGIKLPEEGRVVLFALGDMPPIVFGSVKEARFTFKALKIHPDFKTYFIEGSDVIPVADLDEVSLHQKAVLVKSSLHLLQWLGADYGTGK